MSITLNSIAVAQPSTVKEEIMQIYHDRMTTGGSLRRCFFGTKQQVTLTWPYLVPADYQAIIAMFITGQLVAYSNTTSNYAGGTVSFSGFPMHTESEYLRGNTLIRSLTVVIRQA